jgi:iron complex transport system ATP-binding protein
MLTRAGSLLDRVHHAAGRSVTTATSRDRPLDQLSGGERQRVMLARALAQEPRCSSSTSRPTHLDLRHHTGI